MANAQLIHAPTLSQDDECFFRGAHGILLPNATTFMNAFHSGLEGHGYMGEDGFKNNISRETTKHYSFGGRHIKTTQDRYEETITATFYEQSPNVLASVFGDDNVTVSLLSGHRQMTVRHSDEQLPLSSFVIRTIEGEKTVVHVAPDGRIVEVEEIELRHDQLWQYTVTIDCYKPATGTNPSNPNGVNVYYDEPDVTSGT